MRPLARNLRSACAGHHRKLERRRAPLPAIATGVSDMRISLGSLDPASPLALRIADAIARDQAARMPSANGATSGRSNQAGDQAPRFASEERLHAAIYAMAAAEVSPGVIVFHPANGGRRGKAEAGRLKSIGVTPGIPDLIVIADGKAYGLEIKTDAGRLSKAQKQMAERFRRAGCEYQVVRSVAAARAILVKWGAIEGGMNAAA